MGQTRINSQDIRDSQVSDSDLATANIAVTGATASSIPRSLASGKLAVGWISEVLSITGLSDVTAREGNGTTVLFSDSPTINTPNLDAPVISSWISATHTHSGDINGGYLHANAINTGTIATARLGSGTANSGSYLRGDQTWAADFYIARISGDVTTTSASAADVTGISFTIGANEIWMFDAYLSTQGSTANGHKWAIDVPASCTIHAIAKGSRAAVTSIISDTIVADDTLTATFGTGSYTSGGWVQINGIAANSTNAGTVQIRFAAAVGGDTITVKANSYIIARRIS